MPNNSAAASSKLFLYCLAGVATAPGFMDGLRAAWVDRFERGGWQVHAELVYPYGDWSRHWSRQLPEALSDLRLREASRRSGRGGGAPAFERIAGTYTGGPLLLLGHSAGGLAALAVAERLTGMGHAPRVVQIGSPRCAVSGPLRRDVLYLYAANARGRSVDPITWLGGWGGWERGRFGVPRWNARRYAPAAVQGLPIRGGHPDYFRAAPPFLGPDGRSNLELTSEAIGSWLSARAGWP